MAQTPYADSTPLQLPFLVALGGRDLVDGRSLGLSASPHRPPGPLRWSLCLAAPKPACARHRNRGGALDARGRDPAGVSSPPASGPSRPSAKIERRRALGGARRQPLPSTSRAPAARHRAYLKEDLRGSERQRGPHLSCWPGTRPAIEPLRLGSRPPGRNKRCRASPALLAEYARAAPSGLSRGRDRPAPAGRRPGGASAVARVRDAGRVVHRAGACGRPGPASRPPRALLPGALPPSPGRRRLSLRTTLPCPELGLPSQHHDVHHGTENRDLPDVSAPSSRRRSNPGRPPPAHGESHLNRAIAPGPSGRGGRFARSDPATARAFRGDRHLGELAASHLRPGLRAVRSSRASRCGPGYGSATSGSSASRRPAQVSPR